MVTDKCTMRWLFISWSTESLSTTKGQELQQPDFSIAIWSVHTGNTQLEPSDKATCELWMSLPTSTSYLNDAVCAKVQRSRSAVGDVKWHNGCQVIFPQRSTTKWQDKNLLVFFRSIYRTLLGAQCTFTPPKKEKNAIHSDDLNPVTAVSHKSGILLLYIAITTLPHTQSH